VETVCGNILEFRRSRAAQARHPDEREPFTPLGAGNLMFAFRDEHRSLTDAAIAD
jgi:hypothetical protein